MATGSLEPLEPGWGTTEMVGNGEWLARLAVHAMPLRSTHRRRAMDGGSPPAILPLLAQIGEVLLTRSVLGPDALQPLLRPNLPTPDLLTLAGRSSLATCGDVDTNPGPDAAVPGMAPLQDLSLDTALAAPGIRWHFTMRADSPGHTLWWCTRCGMSWRTAQVSPTCPDGCAPTDGPPRKVQQGWLRHKELVIGKRCTEYQALNAADLVGGGTASPHIDHPCPG